MSAVNTPNITVIRQWVADLRSDRYEQGRDVLKMISPSGVRHCCLGVLCEQAVASGVVKELAAAEGPAWFVGVGDRRSSKTSLPPSVARWAGLAVHPRLGGWLAAHLNDIERLTFAQIADLIEAEYLGEGGGE